MSDLKRKFYTDGEITLVLAKTYGKEAEYHIEKTYVFDIYLYKTWTLVGQCDLRVGTGWYLYYLGNVGYSIYIPFRGHHYAAKACQLLFEAARQEGIKSLIITCDPENVASYKTIVYVGGILKEIVPVPFEHELYKRGETRKCIFEVDISGE